MTYGLIRHRLTAGRPLVTDSDVAAALGARGCSADEPGALGAVLHREAHKVREHHLAELSCRVDILSALTADTTPRALAESGMEHRAARLTGRAVDLALGVADESSRAVAVAGVLGSDQISASTRYRAEEEISEHAARVATAGCDLIVVRGMGSRLELVYAVAAAAAQEIPTWAVVDQHLGEHDLSGLLESIHDAGAEVVLFEVTSVQEGLDCLFACEVSEVPLIPGSLLAADPEAVRGFPAPLEPGWVEGFLRLTDAGARVVGGGAGTTEIHSYALATQLGILHPSMPPGQLGIR